MRTINSMKAVVSTEFTIADKDNIEQMLDICPHCHHGKWKGEECKELECPVWIKKLDSLKKEQLKRVERRKKQQQKKREKEIEELKLQTSKHFKKKYIKMVRCLVCGLPVRRRAKTCSLACLLREYSKIFLPNGKIEYKLSEKQAKQRAEKYFNRK